MSRFYASIKGTKKVVTRRGHNEIIGHLRGWKVGIRVRGFIDNNGKNSFQVFLTGGSGDDKHYKFIGEFKEGDKNHDKI